MRTIEEYEAIERENLERALQEAMKKLSNKERAEYAISLLNDSIKSYKDLSELRTIVKSVACELASNITLEDYKSYQELTYSKKYDKISDLILSYNPIVATFSFDSGYEKEKYWNDLAKYEIRLTENKESFLIDDYVFLR